MKIAFISNYRHFSGALEVFRLIARYAKAAGHTTAYIWHAERDGDIPPDLTMFDELIPHIITEGAAAEHFGNELANIANRFDVVHHSLIPQSWRYAFKNSLTIPQVETYHSLDGWKWCWRAYKWRLKSGAEKPATVTTAVSKGLAAQIQADMPGVDVRSVMNGVEIPETIAPGGDYITYCGRISDNKGLDVWLRIFNAVRKEIPQAKAQWVGELSPHHEKWMFDCIRAAAPWLECVGFQSDLSEFYRRSKCLLLTSPSEGLPMVALEAASHGIPTIAFNTGDVKETTCMIADNEDGAFRAVLALFWEFDRWVNRKGLRRFAVENFSASAMAKRYLDIYGEIFR